MEQEQVFTAVLKRAQSMGAVIPIEQTAMDLGIQIVVKSIIFDSIVSFSFHNISVVLDGGVGVEVRNLHVISPYTPLEEQEPVLVLLL